MAQVSLTGEKQVPVQARVRAALETMRSRCSPREVLSPLRLRVRRRVRALRRRMLQCKESAALRRAIVQEMLRCNSAGCRRSSARAGR